MFQRRPTHPSKPLRLLVVTDDPSSAICDFVAFADAGFDVLVCTGPDDDRLCPVLEGRRCELVDGSDVLLNALSDPSTQKAMVESVHAVSPELPMVVSLAPGMDTDLPEGCVALTGPVSVSGQTAAIRRAATAKREVSSTR